jgi:hypothetical protein
VVAAGAGGCCGAADLSAGAAAPGRTSAGPRLAGGREPASGPPPAEGAAPWLRPSPRTPGGKGAMEGRREGRGPWKGRERRSANWAPWGCCWRRRARLGGRRPPPGGKDEPPGGRRLVLGLAAAVGWVGAAGGCSGRWEQTLNLIL